MSNHIDTSASRPITCLACGADAVIWADDGDSCKCDECGQFDSRY